MWSSWKTKAPLPTGLTVACSSRAGQVKCAIGFCADQHRRTTKANIETISNHHNCPALKQQDFVLHTAHHLGQTLIVGRFAILQTHSVNYPLSLALLAECRSSTSARIKNIIIVQSGRFQVEEVLQLEWTAENAFMTFFGNGGHHPVDSNWALNLESPYCLKWHNRLLKWSGSIISAA